MTVLVVAGVLALAYLLRAVPSWLSPQGLGVDHWFWKNYIEVYRKERQFPPALPQYLLDEAQWYPPLFPLLMSWLPARVFEAWNHQIAVIIDLCRMALLLAAVVWQSDGSPGVLLVAGLIYATTPIQTSYNIQLNPRGLGALMLDALLITLLWSFYVGDSWVAWLLAAAIGGLILLTHKMTTQLFWFVALGTGIIYQRWQVVALIPASMVMAALFSKGFYWKVLIAHWDIVTFWNRNWKWIGADPIRESPVYGDGKYERPQKLHKPGLRGLLWHAFILLGFNPAAWLGCMLAYERVFVRSPFLIYPTYLLVWLMLPCLFALLTTFVPRLKCLGAGYLYIYNTSLMCSLLFALTFRYTRNPEFSTLLVLLAVAVNAAGLLVYYRELLTNKRTRVDETLNRMIDRLRDQPAGVVMCLPSNWHEVVAYKTGYPVLWGAHGYGFRHIEPLWPRLLLPLTEVVRRYRVRYLLTSNDMIPANLEPELAGVTCVRDGEYRLYSFDTSREAPAS
ncbi:MAG TPA: hypothetical protein VEA16_09665 [Vicinamibacterales bacterium]|nr:hypothetical protein [Vicinamibacterales bacterium]